MTEDYILILQLIGGSKQAFSALYQKYVDRVYGYVLSMSHNQTIAEDITQYCFMKVWEHHARLRPEDNFAAYLYVIARNATYNETRRRLSASRYADFVAHSTDIALNYTLSDVNVSMLAQLQNRYRFGLGYRIAGSVNVILGMEIINGLQLGYTYELPANALLRESYGSHELYLAYGFNILKPKNTNKYKSIRYL